MRYKKSIQQAFASLKHVANTNYFYFYFNVYIYCLC